MKLKERLYYSVLPINGRHKAIKFVNSLSMKKAFYMFRNDDLRHISNLFGLEYETFYSNLERVANDYKDCINS